MTDYTLTQIVEKSRDAKRGGKDAWSVQSTGEKLAVALVLNRADWLARIPKAARLLADEDAEA